MFALFLARKSKKSFSRNSIFSLLFFEYKRNFYMTLVSDSPHVALLLRINISKLICDFQANFMLRYSPHVALLLRINISKFGCALLANFILRYSPHVASLLRINISKLGFALQAYLTKSYRKKSTQFTSLRAAGFLP